MGSDAASRGMVSELSYTVGHPAGVTDMLGGNGRSTLET